VPIENKEPCLTAGLSLVTSQKSVFSSRFPANEDPLVGTRRVTDSKGFSLNCPITVLGSSFCIPLLASNLGSIVSLHEYQHFFEFGPIQLSLSFNVHHIDQTLSLAPNGRWSKMNFQLNKDGLVYEFLEDLKRFTRGKIRNKKSYFEAFDMVLANLLLSHQQSSQLLLSRKNGQHKTDNPLGIDNRTIGTITDYLADRGLIDLHIGMRNADDKNSSWCIPLLPLVAILDRYDAKLRLHKKTQFAVVRDNDKNPISMYTNNNKALALAKYGRPVERHYKTWLNHTATLDDRYLLPWLKRLFNLNMDLGGRFYGHYQQIPSAERKRILIDGERTVELDYKSLHIALLYSLEGLPLTSDPYVIDGHEDERNTFKSITLCLVNSENLGSFKANITRSGNLKVQQTFKNYTDRRQHYEYLRALGLKAKVPKKPKVIEKGFIKHIPLNAKGGELLSLLMDKHEPIAHHFGTKDIGLKLQKLDSELMANSLDKLDGIPCLPVHDSIRCRLSDMQLVTNAMRGAFKELHGQNIVVTNDLPAIG
jgi:hypothetical protein